jgi:hypothetical protein
MVKNVGDNQNNLRALFDKLYQTEFSFDQWKEYMSKGDSGQMSDIVLFGCMFKVNVVVHTIDSSMFKKQNVRQVLTSYDAITDYGSLVPLDQRFHLFHHVFGRPTSVPQHGEYPNHYGILNPVLPNTAKVFDPEGDGLFEGGSSKPVYRVDRQPLVELYLVIARNLHMHRLGAVYFRLRYRWVLFLPSTVITAIASILSFLSESKAVGGSKSGKVSLWFSIAVGILAIVSVFLQTLSSELNYQGKAEMHEAVSLDLRRVLDSLDIEGVDGDLEAFKGDAVMQDLKEKYEARSQQTLNGCKYVLPLEIVAAFALVSSRFSTSDAYRRLARKKDTRWPTIFTIVYDEIFIAISKSCCFPLFLPPPEEVVAVAMKRLTYSRFSGLKSLKS